MDFSEVITKRHSVRQFEDKSIEREVIDAMISDANLAPSSKNTRSSGFIVVEDPDTLLALSQMRDYGSALLSGAAAAIIVVGDTEKTDLWRENCSISATYLMLSATAHGLGSCWVHINGRLRERKNPKSQKAEDYVIDLLGLKDNIKPLCAIALGYESL